MDSFFWSTVARAGVEPGSRPNRSSPAHNANPRRFIAGAPESIVAAGGRDPSATAPTLGV